jgi:hypothetical protein
VIRTEDRRSHHTEEVDVMSDEDTNGGGKVKTLAIRLEPEVHAQLSLITQLRKPKGTIADEIRIAIDKHIDAMKSMPELAAQADSVLEEIEREAASRREAIATLFGESGSEGQQPEAGASGGRSRSRRSGKDEEVSES